MPKPSSKLADILIRRYRSLESSRLEVEKLLAKGHITRRAVTHSYEGLFLSAHVAFESFLEDLFVGLLVHNRGLESSRHDVVPRVVVKSHKVARELITRPGRPYVDWLPYDHTLRLAEKYFRGARPFSGLTEAQLQHLRRCNTIRNVIAHKSRHSLEKFQKQVVQSTPLPPHERVAVGYLRGLFRTSPSQSRFENYLAQLLLIARALAQ